jgi:hypothetical protein
MGQGAKLDRFRHSIERMARVRNLSSTDYEQWLDAIETASNLRHRSRVVRERLFQLRGLSRLFDRGDRTRQADPDRAKSGHC